MWVRWCFTALGGWGLLLAACFPAIASSGGGNCVAYARDVTGVHLDGNAAAWWPHAEGRYERGHQPSTGAILVFKPFAGMRVGHVAVVSRVIGPREVLVDQANWVRGRVTKSMSVVDASPANDWTSVKVQFAGTHGRPNPTYGFIYPKVLPANFGETIVESQNDRQHDRHHAGRVAEKAKASPDHIVENAKAPKDKDKDKPVRVAAKKSDPAKVAKKSDPTKPNETTTAEAKAAKAKPAPRPAQSTPALAKPAPVETQVETQVANVF
jgi:surface antigen